MTTNTPVDRIEIAQKEPLMAHHTDDSNQPPAEHWWHGAVVYECHLPVLRDGNGDGIGDLIGLRQALPYLRSTLGVDAVWTGPFYKSPMMDQGFDVEDYMSIDPIFGTMTDFDALVAEAKQVGIRIVIDYIPNHTSDRHPWFIESRSSRTNPRRDWYTWQDPKPDGSPPNNWLSEAGGSMWQFDEVTGQYYLHTHLAEQPDLNWRNPDVRAAMLDVLEFWLRRGIDGVRIDVAHILMKDPDLRDNPVGDAANNAFDLQHPDFGTQVHVYDRRHPDVHDAMRMIRQTMDLYPTTVAIAEIEGMEWDAWAQYYGTARDEMHLPFPFRIIETPWNAAHLHEELTSMYAALPDDVGPPIIALGNHDRVRLASRIGPDQARVAAVLLLTLAATPCLFYGDELGLEDQPVPREHYRDYFARSSGGVSRDPSRTPMPWNTGTNTGFSSAHPDRLWLPVYRVPSVSVERQLTEPDSILNLYRSLLDQRSRNRVFRHGDITFCGDGTDGVLIYERHRGADRRLIALNLTANARLVTLQHRIRIELSTTNRPTGTCLDSTVTLSANEAIIASIQETRA